MEQSDGKPYHISINLPTGPQGKLWTFSQLVLERRTRGTVVGYRYHDNSRVRNHLNYLWRL